MSENMGQMSRMNAAHEATFNKSIQETQEANLELDNVLDANQMEVSQEKLQTEAEENSAMGIMIKTQKLVKKQDVRTDKAKAAQKSVLVRKEDADGLADQFSQRRGNREYHIDSKLLSSLAEEELGAGINENCDPDEVINIVRRRLMTNGQMPDVAIVDKALEFLLEVSHTQLAKATGVDKERFQAIIGKIEQAKTKHFDAYAIDIQVAQKIIGAVDAVVEKTGQTVKETLDRYRDVVHNPPDLQTLRKFYEGKGYRAMALELKGLNSYLGGNFKRTNLENPELAQLAAAARKMQALLGVFRQSRGHIPTMESYLELNGILEEAA